MESTRARRRRHAGQERRVQGPRRDHRASAQWPGPNEHAVTGHIDGSDELVWVLVECLGARIALHAGRVVTEEVERRLPPIAVVRSAAMKDQGPDRNPRFAAVVKANHVGSRRYVVNSSDVGESEVEGAEELVRAVSSSVQLSIAAHATDAVFIHAGAVAWNGAGIVLPGGSFVGKTTLVTALVRAGAEYYSDEYAVLGPDGRLIPYAKPLSVRTAGGTIPIPPGELGLVGESAVDVRLVVISHFEAGATWQPKLHRGAEVALPLVENAVAATVRPIDVLDVAARVAGTAVLARGARPDADAVALSLLELLELLDTQTA